MKLFEDNKPPQDAAALVLALLREFKEVPSYVPSKFISPSGLNCQVSAAFKLQGIPTEAQKESFQSKCFTENGEDRHKRIQAFLSQTPYWVDVEEYIVSKKLPLKVVKKEDYEVLLEHETLPIRFKCDGMLLIEGVYYVLEIKTERGSANVYRTSWDLKHRRQGLSYSYILATDRILWLYEGREYLEQKPFVQIVSKQDKNYITKFIEDIVKYRDTPEMLERAEKDCGYCAYKAHCRAYFKEIKKREKEAQKCQSQNLLTK